MAFMAIEQCGFFDVAHLSWHRPSLFNSHLPWHSHLLPSMALEMSLPVLSTTSVPLGYRTPISRIRGQRSCSDNSFCPLTHECNIMERCIIFIHYQCMALTFCFNIKIIFSPWICDWARKSLPFDTGIQNLAHTRVQPWDNMLSTFMTSVYVSPWPLTYMWVTRDII